MTDQPRWLQKLARFAQTVGQDTTAEQDAQLAPSDARLDQLAAPANAASTKPVGMATTSGAAAGAAAAADAEVWAWIERGGVDLGHAELRARIYDRANAAYIAGDSSGWSQLNTVAERLEEVCDDYELAAIQTAVTLPDPVARQAYLDGKQGEMRRHAQELVARFVDDLDLTVPEAIDPDTEAEILAESGRLHGMERVDNDVRHAYHVALNEAQDTDPGKRWLYLTDVREELAYQARRDGYEPHTRQDVDAALQRLTHSDQFTAHVIPEDAEHLLSDEHREAAVRFGGADRHMSRIDYPEYSTTDEVVEQDGAHTTVAATAADLDDDHSDDVTDQAGPVQVAQGVPGDEYTEQRIGDLVSRADFAEMNAERLDDADLRGQAAEQREAAEQLRSEAQQLARDNGSANPYEHDQHDEQAGSAVADQADDAAEQRDDDRSAATDDSDMSETARDADVAPAEEKTTADERAIGESAEVQPVAVTETTACTVAVTRARCVVDRVHRQFDAVEQEAAVERDDELARWHADDTAVQADSELAVDDAATQDSSPVLGR